MCVRTSASLISCSYWNDCAIVILPNVRDVTSHIVSLVRDFVQMAFLNAWLDTRWIGILEELKKKIIYDHPKLNLPMYIASYHI